ncbi:hypothetical protein SAMN05216327_11756 [Dyadobacter sp. SG02]|uniref:hypothetical protein n=1 Tax=Dyadobacter sp. SG02 TaxID=1855291 RepID=UPI0008BB6032|nr:hypothetical protein [Dyadobacter sp. SG02]SEJ72167.1 hypothetical protein SAMN05216327_11756 [Dyadobacter sp. SG02]
MRRLASIGLLALLLYNMFGLSLAVIFFEKDYQVATFGEPGQVSVMKMYLPSLPYSGNLEITENIEGLVRQDGQFYNPTHILHENDTLYVTLQSNEAARDHFFELANAIQVLNDPQTDAPESPYGKAIELLGNLLKIYIPNTQQFPARSESVAQQIRSWANSQYVAVHYLSYQTSLASPPPEHC